jgi:hypothetical protein
MNFQNCRVNIITNYTNRRSEMVNVLAILKNNTNSNNIKATLLRLPLLNNNKRHYDIVLNPEYIHHIYEVIFNEENNEVINYLGMESESYHNESRAYVTDRQVNLKKLNNNYYIIRISQEYFSGLMT